MKPRLTQSLRWRMQFWYALLIAAALGGFGFVAYRQQESHDLKRIDLALERQLGVMQGELREELRGPRGGPPSRPGSPAERVLGLLEFLDSQKARTLLASNDLEGDYFIIWDRDGTVLGSLGDAPEDVPFPVAGSEDGDSGRSVFRNRGDVREAFRFRLPGDCLLLGKSLEPERREWSRLGWQLAFSGLGVLALGLVGGWFFLSRAIRPIQAISRSARAYAGGDLGTRIPEASDGGELGQLTEDLNETFDQLEKAFARQSRFTADAAHELRTPVSVILSRAQAALLRERDNAAYKEALVACERGAQRLRRLIDSLLTLSSFDSSTEDGARDAVDLATVAGDCADFLMPLLEERQLAFELQLDAAPCLGNADHLNQVFVNLIANAVHFSNEGGVIGLSTGHDGGWVWARVSDRGKGIAEAHLPHLFERFYRVEAGRSREAGGAGLGLAICDEIVRGHGGSMQVESEEGVGTTFTIKIPVAT